MIFSFIPPTQFLKSVMFYTENKLTINRLMLSVYVTKKSVLVYMMIKQSKQKFSSIHEREHTWTGQLSFPGSSPNKIIIYLILVDGHFHICGLTASKIPCFHF